PRLHTLLPPRRPPPVSRRQPRAEAVPPRARSTHARRTAAPRPAARAAVRATQNDGETPRGSLPDRGRGRGGTRRRRQRRPGGASRHRNGPPPESDSPRTAPSPRGRRDCRVATHASRTTLPDACGLPRQCRGLPRTGLLHGPPERIPLAAPAEAPRRTAPV